MPRLSETGADRDEYLNKARQYTIEFDTVGAKTITAVPAHKRNIKINLVTDAFFHPGDKSYDIQDAEHYGKVSRNLSPTIARILNMLKLPDTRETFGLTYRDLIEMDDVTLSHIHEEVAEMYKQRVETQKQQEKILHDSK